ncbi:hypothetical protein L598_004100000170 [Mesorhizobium sp. J18]|nr:hypothetical protein L598_004100000170 [Mesorhizobium sp. J18]
MSEDQKAIRQVVETWMDATRHGESIRRSMAADTRCGPADSAELGPAGDSAICGMIMIAGSGESALESRTRRETQ